MTLATASEDAEVDEQSGAVYVDFGKFTANVSIFDTVDTFVKSTTKFAFGTNSYESTVLTLFDSYERQAELGHQNDFTRVYGLVVRISNQPNSSSRD